MARATVSILIAGVLLALAAAPAGAQAFVAGQSLPLAQQGRDCQTVRQCRFTSGGSYRGCISAYACRVCRFVDRRCTITGREQTCRKVECAWGT